MVSKIEVELHIFDPLIPVKIREGVGKMLSEMSELTQLPNLCTYSLDKRLLHGRDDSSSGKKRLAVNLKAYRPTYLLVCRAA